jgi:5-methyltetrahydrofolate corrinoid/iron sulfur protein methyltransferase
MFIIGELINGMYANISRAIKAKDKAIIQKIALLQLDNGADALDVNCGPASVDPVNDMRWLVESIREVTDVELAIDSSKPKVIASGIEAAKRGTIINSVSADIEKMDALVPLAVKSGSKLIALAMSAKGIPGNKEQRLELAALIVTECDGKGFDLSRLYIDPVVLPVNVAQVQIKEILDSIGDFKILSAPPPKTIVGLSNISQGSSGRSLINRTFLAMALSAGLDAAILDPTDKELMDSLITAETLLNRRIYCDSYLDTYKKKGKNAPKKFSQA